MYQNLRRSGGSLIVTIPKAFVESNGLTDGSQLHMRMAGAKITLEVPPRKRYKLAELMAEMPEGLPTVPGWDEMPAVGREHS